MYCQQLLILPFKSVFAKAEKLAWIVELLMVSPILLQMDCHPCVFRFQAIVVLVQHLIRWRCEMARMPWATASHAKSGQNRTTTLGSLQSFKSLGA